MERVERAINAMNEIIEESEDDSKFIFLKKNIKHEQDPDFLRSMLLKWSPSQKSKEKSRERGLEACRKYQESKSL